MPTPGSTWKPESSGPRVAIDAAALASHSGSGVRPAASKYTANPHISRAASPSRAGGLGRRGPGLARLGVRARHHRGDDPHRNHHPHREQVDVVAQVVDLELV